MRKIALLAIMCMCNTYVEFNSLMERIKKMLQYTLWGCARCQILHIRGCACGFLTSTSVDSDAGLYLNVAEVLIYTYIL